MKGLQKDVNCGLARIDFKYFRFMNGTHSCVNMRVKWRESFSGWFSFSETQGHMIGLGGGGNHGERCEKD